LLRRASFTLDSTFNGESVMPRLVPIFHPETPAVLALRRTLWQLAFVGIVTAALLARIAPGSGALASWFLLLPLSALAVHYRQALLDLLRSHRDIHSSAVSRRRQPAQARRARGGNPSSPRRQPRLRAQGVPSQVRPLAR
jgi:hypothetical protein